MSTPRPTTHEGCLGSIISIYSNSLHSICRTGLGQCLVAIAALLVSRYDPTAVDSRSCCPRSVDMTFCKNDCPDPNPGEVRYTEAKWSRSTLYLLHTKYIKRTTQEEIKGLFCIVRHSYPALQLDLVLSVYLYVYVCRCDPCFATRICSLNVSVVYFALMAGAWAWPRFSSRLPA